MQRSETDTFTIEQIKKQLDAALAARDVTRPFLSLSPNAQHWPIVDFAVRQWALANGFSVERNDREIEGRRYVSDWYTRDGRSLVSVSVPDALHSAHVTELTADILEVR